MRFKVRLLLELLQSALRQRFAEKVALEVFAAVLQEQLQLLLAFYAFGDNTVAQQLGHVDERGNDGLCFALGGSDIVDEGFVDF